MSWADVGAGSGGVIGGTVGWAFGADDRDKAGKNYEDAVQQYRRLNPTMTSYEMGPSAYDRIHNDPSTRDAQLQALQQLQQTYKQGGMDNTYRAQVAAAQQDSANRARAMNAAVQNNAAQRGLASSGQSIAAQRSNAQAAANSSAMQNMQAAQGAQSRQMAALQATGQLGGQLRAQDYGQAADRAQASDAISRFNMAQRTNAAQASYNNSLARAQGMQSAYAGDSNYKQGLADSYTNLGYAHGSMAGGAAGTYADSQGGGGGGGGGGMDMMKMFGGGTK